MARPKKSDKRPQNPTDVDINKLDEELEKDVAKASGLLDEEDAIVEEDDSNTSEFNNGNNNFEYGENQNHGYEMPPSERPIQEDIKEEVPKVDLNYIPEDDGSPLEETVKHRDYASNGGDIPKNDLNNGIPKVEPVIPEPISVSAPISDVNVGAEIEEPKTSQQPKQPSEPKRPDINPKLEDLSPSQKRKAAEQSADALLLAYGNIVPIPFKKISSFNLGKLDNAHLKGEVDKDMVISEDGTTVKSYCEGVNQQVDQTFEITQEMKDEIRPPLIDVLLENNFALTPTQRLLMAVGGQIVTMVLTAVQFMQQNKATMNQFKAFHKENKDARANIVKETVTIRTEPVREQPSSNYRTEQNNSNYETIIPEPEIKTEKTKKVEDYISNNNNGITVEEVPNED